MLLKGEGFWEAFYFNVYLLFVQMMFNLVTKYRPRGSKATDAETELSLSFHLVIIGYGPCDKFPDQVNHSCSRRRPVCHRDSPYLSVCLGSEPR
jgi:anthranilate/para-aminobenzoate synthase component II